MTVQMTAQISRPNQFRHRAQRIEVGADGLLRIDGVVLCRVVGRGTMEIIDKDPHRSRRRETNLITFGIAELTLAIKEYVEKHDSC